MFQCYMDTSMYEPSLSSILLEISSFLRLGITHIKPLAHCRPLFDCKHKHNEPNPRESRCHSICPKHAYRMDAWDDERRSHRQDNGADGPA